MVPTQAPQGYLSALTESGRNPHKKANDQKTPSLVEMFANQIVVSIRDGLNNLLDGEELLISKIYLTNQLGQYLSDEQLGVDFDAEEDLRNIKILKLEIDNVDLENPTKILKLTAKVRKRTLELIDETGTLRGIIKNAEYIYCRVKSNLQPVISLALDNLEENEIALVAGAERMDGVQNPGNLLAKQTLPDEFLENQQTDSMGKTIEGVISHLLSKLEIPPDIYNEFMARAATYSRLRSLRAQDYTVNPAVAKDHYASCNNDLERFNALNQDIEKKDSVMTKYLYKLFKMSYCCVNANGAGASLLSKNKITKDAFAILARHTELNANSIEDRYAGISDIDQTISQAYHELYQQFDPRENEGTMLTCIHNAFSILIILFLNEMNKLEGGNIQEKMQNFNQLTKSKEGLKQLDDLGILPFGGLYGGHPTGSTALNIAARSFDHFKNTPPEDLKTNLALIGSVWGPLEAISLILLRYEGSKPISQPATPSNPLSPLDLAA